MSQYTAKDITVLEGLEPVRVRPAMYIGGTDKNGLHHLVWEALDNSVDEAINGFCNKIEITLTKDGSARVRDNGRGIPVDVHPKIKKPALEVIMCTLHAGAKFHNKNYSSSGGLHGVGISVVNALSESMEVISTRDGFSWKQTFARGKPTSKLKKQKPTRKTGTVVHFQPDPEIFSGRKFDFETIVERSETKAFINRGLSIHVVDEAGKKEKSFKYENGIQDFILKVIGQKMVVGSHHYYRNQLDDLKMECTFCWTEETESRVFSYCNSIYTRDGGTHETGLRNALSRAIRSYLERKNGKTKNLQPTTDDVREGLSAVISIFIPHPQFQGQTKEKLNNPEIGTRVESFLKGTFEQYLLENPNAAEQITGRVLMATQARLASRAAKEQVRRKTLISHRLTLPGKLADCASTDPTESELFIVEGESAGGSSKQARDRRTQAVLPLRGKILNVETATPEKLFNNAEIKALVITLGTDIGDNFDINKLRYHKVIIMTDADVDGAHISALLLTFFYRYTKPLIEEGYVFLAQPPLYRIEIGKEIHYALTDEEKEKILKKNPEKKAEVSRFKGLGEMPASVLKETTMDPAKRFLLRVSISNLEQTDSVIERLMGKDAAPRFKFIQEHSENFEIDI